MKHANAAILTLVMFLAASLTVEPASAAGEPICALGTPDPKALSSQNSTFDPATPTWTFANTHASVGWHTTTNPGANAADDAVGHTQPYRLYYGSTDPTRASYETAGESNAGSATSPTILIPADASNIQLVFRSKYAIEAKDPASHDQMLVHLSLNDGASWSTLCRVSPTSGGALGRSACSNGQSQGANPCPNDATGDLPRWETRVIPLSGAAGKSLRVRFSFDTIDASYNEQMGWMIDDVRITYTAPAQAPDRVGFVEPDTGIGSYRPCSTQQPRASENLGNWAAWYAIHVFDGRSVFKPASPPAKIGNIAPITWVPPAIPLPVPDTGLRVCKPEA